MLKNIMTVKEMVKDLSEAEFTVLKEYTVKLLESFEKAEYKYIDLVFEMGGAEGLTAEDMKQYIAYLCQLRLFQLGYIGVSEVGKNPLEWMEWLLGANKHSAFFEKKVTDYVHKELSGDVNYNKYRSLIA